MDRFRDAAHQVASLVSVGRHAGDSPPASPVMSSKQAPRAQEDFAEPTTPTPRTKSSSWSGRAGASLMDMFGAGRQKTSADDSPPPSPRSQKSASACLIHSVARALQR